MAIKTNESVKLTQEEIKQLSGLRTKTSELTFMRGQIGIAEDNIKRQLNELAEHGIPTKYADRVEKHDADIQTTT